MALYQYKAVDEQGRKASGRLEASNEVDLEQRLERIGLFLVRYQSVQKRAVAGGSQAVPRRDLITFCFHLEQLTKGGVPLIEGLTDLRDSVDNHRLREITSTIIEDIEGGRTLSQAMAEYPRVFDEVFVSLIQAGEQSGQLPEVFRSLTESLKWQDETAAYTRRLLMYPAFVGIIVGGVVLFLLIYLVPKLTSFLATMQQEVPFHTKALIAVSDFVVDWWYLVIGLPIALVIAFSIALQRSPNLQYQFDRAKLHMWFIGPILRKVILSRFASFFALMFRSGISVLDCMRRSEGIVGNRAVEEGIRKAGRQIEDGWSISDSFEAAGLFPPLVLRMIRVGETTGALDTALLNVSYFYSRDVRESIEELQQMIGPAMTVVLGAIMFWVIISVLGPIYDLISKIKI